MSVREKLAWAACAVLLVFLYLASSTDLIIKEREVEIHPVSIILNDVNDAYYQNFKKGVDQAARDYYADTSYTTLYDEISQEQQLQLISREMEDGAQAIVVIPVEGEALMDSLREQKSQIPFVVLGTAGGDSAVSSRISVDSREAGRRLAEEALKELPAGVSCWLFAADVRLGETRLVLDGVESVLKEHGADYVLREMEEEESLLASLQEEYERTGEQAAVIALDKESLTETAEILKADGSLREGLAGVYGMGSTTSLLGSLDAGLIDGLVTFDQYTAGYLSVEKAVEAIQSGKNGEDIQLDYFYITRDNMWDKSFETMLYPME